MKSERNGNWFPCRLGDSAGCVMLLQPWLGEGWRTFSEPTSLEKGPSPRIRGVIARSVFCLYSKSKNNQPSETVYMYTYIHNHPYMILGCKCAVPRVCRRQVFRYQPQISFFRMEFGAICDPLSKLNILECNHIDTM